MNSIRKWIRDIFGFSGTEINGFLILLPACVVLVFSEPVYHAWLGARSLPYRKEQKILDSLTASWRIQAEQRDSEDPHQVSLFSFDPNSASVEDLRKLGFSERLSNRIAAYRLKGGVFRIKSDLMKIYGLDSTLYRQLYEYIQLPSRRLVLKDSGKPYQHKATANFPAVQLGEKFDINTADTTSFKRLYGIGPRLAARIVKFREGLGGFVNGNQLYEVYGLDSLVVDRLLKVAFVEQGFAPVKININAGTEEQLSRHPYIRYKLARAVMAYRYQHGDFQQVNDIKKLSAVNSHDLERLLPYIKVKD